MTVLRLGAGMLGLMPSFRSIVATGFAIGVATGVASAQPTDPPRELDAGFIGKGATRLEIDDCPPVDTTTPREQLRKQGAELYARGETLYVQGDYEGAVRELISSYCLIPFYSILKDIGQAHERNLDYEKAIGYLERYVIKLPPDAKKANACAPEPQEDKKNVERRIEVLKKLRAHILVETDPKNADVSISNDGGSVGREKSGKRTIEVTGGRYTMVVEAPGHEQHTQTIEVKIGKPYTYFVPLKPLKGTLSVQVTPADAKIFLRDDTVERFVGIGRVDEKLAIGTYVLISEAPGRVRDERKIEVLPKIVNRMQLELELRPQFGRRQLLAFSAIGAGFATGGLLFAFDDTAFAGLGSIGGAAAGFLGSYIYLPDDVPLGTSNLTITASLAGTVAGTASALLFTSQQRIVQPIQGVSTLLGAGAGYYIGNRVKIKPGDAALINSSMLWGTAAGGLFGFSFDADRRIAAGLVLSGLAMGGVSGVLMARYFDISRRHAVLIDIGGLVGIIGGLAAESLAYPTVEAGDPAANEHVANFALGGMAIGLIGAGILTRNVDTPKIPVKAALGTATDVNGSSTTTYGISGSW